MNDSLFSALNNFSVISKSRDLKFKIIGNWIIFLCDPLGTTVRLAQEANTWTLVPTDLGSIPRCNICLFATYSFLALMPGEYIVTQQ